MQARGKPSTLQNVPSWVKDDPDIILRAWIDNPYVLRFASASLLLDESFLESVIQSVPPPPNVHKWSNPELDTRRDDAEMLLRHRLLSG